MDRELIAVLDACEERIKQGSTTFHRAFSFLPSPRKEAVYVIYAFCRLIDNAVDEPENSEFTLAELEEHFTYLEQAQGHFIWPAIRWLFQTFPVSKEPFYKQMEGQRLDYELTHYDTMEQLETYCYLVAGTVGEMLIPVLHPQPDERLREAGVWLGKAMQIVNVVRDVGEDQGRGRRYIPLELLHKHGYSEQDFAEGRITGAWTALVSELEATARGWFELGLLELDSYPTASGFCMELAARMYAAILDDAASHSYDVFRRRAYVSLWTKTGILRELVRKHRFLLPDNSNGDSVAVIS